MFISHLSISTLKKYVLSFEKCDRFKCLCNKNVMTYCSIFTVELTDKQNDATKSTDLLI